MKTSFKWHSTKHINLRAHRSRNLLLKRTDVWRRVFCFVQLNNTPTNSLLSDGRIPNMACTNCLKLKWFSTVENIARRLLNRVSPRHIWEEETLLEPEKINYLKFCAVCLFSRTFSLGMLTGLRNFILTNVSQISNECYNVSKTSSECYAWISLRLSLFVSVVSFFYGHRHSE